MGHYCVRLLPRDDKEWYYANENVIMHRAQLEGKELDLTYFFMSLERANKLMLHLLMDRKERLDAIAVVEMSYWKPHISERAVVEYKEIKH